MLIPYIQNYYYKSLCLVKNNFQVPSYKYRNTLYVSKLTIEK